MRDVLGQVATELRVHRASPGQDTLDGQAGVLGDLGTCAVGSNEVAGAVLVDASAGAVFKRDGDAVVVLDAGAVKSVELERCTSFCRAVENNRFQVRLGNVHHGAGTG